MTSLVRHEWDNYGTPGESRERCGRYVLVPRFAVDRHGHHIPAAPANLRCGHPADGHRPGCLLVVRDLGSPCPCPGFSR